MLEGLRAHGLKLACVTNKEARHTQRVLEATGLEGRFDLVIGGDTLPVKKPHGDVLRTVALRLGVTPMQHVAHVGDSSIDIACAREAGALAWAVPWGYNGGRQITDSNPDLVFDHFEQLLRHVTQAQPPL